MKTSVGFIGLGLIGTPMAKNILAKGFHLTVYNRTAAKTKILEKLGAKVALSPKSVAENSDVIITMVTAGRDVESVLLGKNGVVEGAKKKTIVIDMSTIGPTYAKKVSKELKKHEIEFLDAPVTGGVWKAETGELTIFVGGDEKVFTKVKSVLSAMGTTIFYIGPVGSGQAIKVINNQILAASTIALSEGFRLADEMKIPRSKVAEVLENAMSVSATMKIIMPNFVKNVYPLKFSNANLSKDVALALVEAGNRKSKFKSMALSNKIYKNATKGKLANEDFSSIIKVLGK